MTSIAFYVERPLPTLTEETEWVEIELEIRGSHVPFVRGRHSGPPENCSPDEGGYVEDVFATYNGVEIDLTLKEAERAEEQLAEAAIEDETARYEDAMDARADAMRERWD
jgi:hypothetical protein